MNKLHIFTQHGKTFTFQHIISFVSNESTITFTYIAMSDSIVKKAIFYVSNIAGYSQFKDDDDDERIRTYQKYLGKR